MSDLRELLSSLGAEDTDDATRLPSTHTIGAVEEGVPSTISFNDPMLRDLQQQVIDLSASEATLKDELATVRKQLSELEERHKYTSDALTEARQKLAERSKTSDEKISEIAALKEDNNRLLSLLARQKQDLDSLMEENRQLGERYAKQTQQLHQAQWEASQTQSKVRR